jgi:hypothetical protein
MLQNMCIEGTCDDNHQITCYCDLYPVLMLTEPALFKAVLDVMIGQVQSRLHRMKADGDLKFILPEL